VKTRRVERRGQPTEQVDRFAAAEGKQASAVRREGERLRLVVVAVQPQELERVAQGK
jgi:hypothetical protein